PLNLNNNIINNLIFNETVNQDSIFPERHEILRITARQNLEQYTEKIAIQMLKKRKLIDFKIGDLVRIKISKIDRFGTNRSSLPSLGATTYPELDEIPSNQISIREAARLQSVELVSCS
ncbi:6621_t:CDS:2, partial [Diversispora eburnea]